MTQPTEEAARIVADLINKQPYNPPEHIFAQYVTDEYEVTDAMWSAGIDAHRRGNSVIDIFRAMIAAKHKDALGGGDPLVEAFSDIGTIDPNGAAKDLRAALATRGLEIVKKEPSQ